MADAVSCACGSAATPWPSRQTNDADRPHHASAAGPDRATCQRGRPAGSRGGGAASVTFDSITNRGEYFADHFFDTMLQGTLKKLRTRWDDAEGKGESTPRTRLRSMSR